MSPVLVLVVLQCLVGAVQGADVRLGCQLGGDEPLPHDAFGDHRVFFAGAAGVGGRGSHSETGKSEGILRVTKSMYLNPGCPSTPEEPPPLQPGHTQVTVVTAPESLGKRVVLNFQLCDLSGEDTQ